MTQEIVVVGAGVAGLAAAAALRDAGHACLVLEAASRIGGRAWTTTPAALGGAAFDHGAAWLHNAADNPLTAIARAHGETLYDSDAERAACVLRAGVPITPEDEAAYAAAQAEFERLTARHLTGADTSLAAAVAEAASMPWMANVLNWEARIIAAAEPGALSLRDWRRNLLEGSNLLIDGGLGAFVARRLATPVQLNTPVQAIAWDGQGVTVTTGIGAIRAAACIVTVSTGVLAADGIAFTPTLPPATLAAIDGLPMGQVTKIALRAAGTGRQGLPESCRVETFIEQPGDGAIAWIAWPRGQDHVIGYIGGDQAGALDGPAAEAEARRQWRAIFGADAAAFTAQGVVTGWGGDPLTRGAYAYARPGHADARAALAEPLAGGRLVFAGEAACTDGLAGTVAGAWRSGRAAAATVTACVAG